MGRGCGKNGINERASDIATRVITKAKTLLVRPSLTSAVFSFSSRLEVELKGLPKLNNGLRLGLGLACSFGFSFPDVNVNLLKPYLHHLVLKLYREFACMGTEKLTPDVNSSIRNHISMLTQTFPTRAVISIGDYTSQILLKSDIIKKSNEFLSFFIRKTKENSTKPRQPTRETLEIINVSEKADTHYWFNVEQYIAENDAIVEKLKSKPIDKLEGAVMIASTGEGVGSAMLTDLAARFMEGNVNAVAFAILPSQLQPPDSFFNSLYSTATCASKGMTQILIERDALESYVGVDRKGAVMNGNRVLTYLVEMVLAKEQFTQEFVELSKTYNLKMFTVLAATGASLRVYGSLKNVLDTAYLRQLASFDLSNVTTLYVIIRMPLHLKDKLPHSQIELLIDDWFREKSSLKSVQVSEPIYINDGSDRVDILMFIGGFDLAHMLTAAEKRINDVKAYASRNGYIKEKEWQELMKSLAD